MARVQYAVHPARMLLVHVGKGISPEQIRRGAAICRGVSARVFRARGAQHDCVHAGWSPVMWPLPQHTQ
eukprot:m.25061 g.25061  ORF g.25061 m.25061 type:complete len:69 (-) comp13130_c0_seq4:1208-1414(-)